MAPRRFLTSLTLLAIPFGLVACDNPACVFGPNGCQEAGDGDSLGSEPATVPEDGAWIEPGGPTVQSMSPGLEAHPETPIAITFSESLNPDSLQGVFSIVDSFTQFEMPFLDPPPVVGDGRVVILDPLIPLGAGSTYAVRFTEDGEATDLTGQSVFTGDGEIGSFTVSESPSETPEVITTFPLDLSTSQSDIGEVVVVFDREMDDTLANSFDTSSWQVTVDGVPPFINPDPFVLAIENGPVAVEIASVWRWASADPSTGDRLSLGAGGRVQVELSLPGDKLVDTEGNELPATVFEYDIASIAVPARVEKGILSDPFDAIGLPNLLDVVPVLQAQLLGSAETDDVLDLFFFGEDPSGDDLIALSRTVTVSARTLLIEALPEDLALIVSGAGAFADGDLHVAVRLRRGAIRTAVRLLDLESSQTGAQPLLFDVTAPKLLGLGTSGAVTDTYASDLRNLVLVGRGDEAIGRVEVSVSSGEDNGVEPAVIMGSADGLFVARPVLIGDGLLDPAAPLTYTARVFDRALNPQVGSVTGVYSQRGAVTGAEPQGAVVDVRVYDQGLLTPVAGALVMVHQDAGGAYSPVPGGSGTTDADGLVSLPASAVGTETIVTVDHEAYDLWTMHGVTTDSLQVPLVESSTTEATTEGEVTTSFPLVNLNTFTNQIGDSRRPDSLPSLFDVESCGIDGNASVYACPFGPETVGGTSLGAQFFLSCDFGVSVGTFTAVTFLRAFATRFPILPAGSGGEEVGGSFFVGDLLATSAAEEQPLEAPAQDLGLAATWAPNLGALSDHPTVTIEALSPGLPAGLPVGLGVAFDMGRGPGPWAVRGAYPGAVDGIEDGGGDELGQLVSDGILEPDLFMRVEAEDIVGNRVGARPRFSNEDSILDPPDLPVFQVPGPANGSGGLTFLVVSSDVIPDSFGMQGLYRYEIQGPGARGWTLWRPDPPGSGSVTTLVPDLAGDFGGTPLPPGAATMRISAYAWLDLDLSGFQWADLEREHEVFAHTVPQGFVLED